jgi:hypothetical protein
LAGKKLTVDQVEVVTWDGPGIQIPNGLDMARAIRVLQRKMEEQEQPVQLRATIEVFPWDGAYALYKAMQQMFGAVVQLEKPGGFFTPDIKRTTINIATDAHGGTTGIPWGIFEVLGMEGSLQTGYTRSDDGRIIFEVVANVKGKYKTRFNELVALTRKILAVESLYRGKALDIAFTDNDGDFNQMPPVKFVDVDRAPAPIFGSRLSDQLEHDVLAYVRYPDEVRQLRGSLKRGVLLAGPYGTGKTLTAGYVARTATQNGFTFIYCKPQDVPHAIDFARMYLPAVIFAEDLETIASGERTRQVNNLLSKLDGIDTKKCDVLTIFTTNNIEQIHTAFLRPGRIDVIMPVNPPDAEAAIAVARRYADGQMLDEDFSEAGTVMAGMIPAVIEEAVGRARIRAVARTNRQSSVISNTDLVHAANSVRAERELFEHEAPKEPAIRFGEAFGGAVGQAMGEAVGTALHSLVQYPTGEETPVLASQNSR